MKHDRPQCFNHPTTIHEGDIPSEDAIDRWRNFILANHGGEATWTINAIFDCAILGARRAYEVRKESTKMLKQRLKALENGIR